MPRLSNERKVLLALLLAALLGGGVYLYLNEIEAPVSTASKPVPAEARDSVPPSADGLPATQPPAQEDDSLVTTTTQILPPEEDTPAPSSPQALLNFAHELSGLMERALDSEKEALPAFAELERCARDPEGKEVIQARLICFANASRLAKQYPDLLGQRFKALAQRHPNLAGMLHTTGLE